MAPGLTPVLLYNGVLHCQSGNGAVSSLTLPTHDAILQAPFLFFFISFIFIFYSVSSLTLLTHDAILQAPLFIAFIHSDFLFFRSRPYGHAPRDAVSSPKVHSSVSPKS